MNETPSGRQELESFTVLGVRIHATNLAAACRTVEEWIRTRTRTYVCVAPVSTVMDCQDDPQYREIVNNAGMTTPDGMPLVWIGRRRGHADIQRTYGPDLMLALCDMSQRTGFRHYFYGGTGESLARLAQRLMKMFPALNIAGSHAPGMLGIGERESDSVLEKINHCRPDILWVGLGSPKQDYWMSLHRERLDVPVIIGAGAAFDFHAGNKPQAPRWMQRSGLEWLFRFCCEPRRLWRRYLVGNTRFIFLLLREMACGGR
ncbi:MAG: WecB/TagA/CpsF family glycosyltransferase [Candidatus Omnitrophota bacterium]|nr:WecB/TagA/CpsF family glycosyltransferase [Candidatus Omnitrophota bacterium]MDZ4241390.1 WecB/TagA/CpsF family glycosyltransferase [Candidatus Omnitrophota bacterium]